MCCKSWDIKKYVKEFEKANINAIHFDVMDGHYVPNITLGSALFNDIRSITSIPIDVHLMCKNPKRFINYFNFKEGDMCCFHPEVCKGWKELLIEIKKRGMRAGIALSPDIDIDYIEDSISLIDYVLVMAVYPGFAGQKMVDSHLNKLKKIKEICKKNAKNIEIIVDGNTSIENSIKMRKNGADSFVVGTSSMLKKGPKEFREAYDIYMNAVK